MSENPTYAEQKAEGIDLLERDENRTFVVVTSDQPDDHVDSDITFGADVDELGSRELRLSQIATLEIHFNAIVTATGLDPAVLARYLTEQYGVDGLEVRDIGVKDYSEEDS